MSKVMLSWEIPFENNSIVATSDTAENSIVIFRSHVTCCQQNLSAIAGFTLLYLKQSVLTISLSH